MKWIMSKVTKFLTDLMITTIMGIEWCIFVGLYSAVELFNKYSKINKKYIEYEQNRIA